MRRGDRRAAEQIDMIVEIAIGVGVLLVVLTTIGLVLGSLFRIFL